MRQVNWNARTMQTLPKTLPKNLIAAFAFSAATALAVATVASANEARQTKMASLVGAEHHHVDGKNFTLDSERDGECKAGNECHVTVKLKAVGDYHINKEYPYKFKAEGAGVEFLGTDAAGKNTFSKSANDFVIVDEKNATMTIRFKPAAKGMTTIKGTLKMSVCSAQNCQLETQDVVVDVLVK
jgi:hypothetical protein